MTCLRKDCDVRRTEGLPSSRCSRNDDLSEKGLRLMKSSMFKEHTLRRNDDLSEKGLRLYIFFRAIVQHHM